MNETNITILDNQNKNLKDKTSVDMIVDGNNKYGIPRGGLVKIFEEIKGKKRKLINRSNLIVYSGRKILAQRAINMDRVSGSTEKDYYISWFSMGTGGTDGINVLQPIPPAATDTSLTSEIIINGTDANNIDGGWKHPIDGFTFEADAENLNEPIIIKSTITIDYGDANGNNISEAGLWMSDSDNTSIVNVSTLTMWARVTFSTLQKDSSRKFIFDWYLYF